MSGHSLLSPSSAHRWIPCPGSVKLSQGAPDETSRAAAEGTAAHTLAEWCLRTGTSANKYPDLSITVTSDDGLQSWTFDLDDEFCAYVQAYVDNTMRHVDKGAELRVEQRVDLSDILDVPDQGGTADALIVHERPHVRVTDLKFGRGVQVFAKDNPQLYLYGLGAVEEVALVKDVDTVTVVIDQPRLDHYDEHTLTIGELREFGEEAREAAARAKAGMLDEALALTYLNPGDSQCRFCPAKGRCPAYADLVKTTVFEDLEAEPPVLNSIGATPDDLARNRSLVDLIEGWCAAVVKETDARLNAGVAVPGWKLVKGRKGARKWSDEAAAEAEMKAMRLKKELMYTMAPKSPTQIEKELSEKRMARLLPLVVQDDGKPQSVPESDKRPALQPAESFDDETVSDTDADDLL